MDLFEEKARDWDTRPGPARISEGFYRSLCERVDLSTVARVLDFGAGTGLVAARLAPRVERILAVDVSRAMLDQLVRKPELQGRVVAVCQDILDEPLDERVDLVVSAMAMHHVEDTDALLRSLYAHLVPGGHLALADLDAEDGSFHAPGTEGIYHHGFDRDTLRARAERAGFENVTFATACVVEKEDRTYPVFLLTATRPR
jgi:predicted TPR repeat methyltransferase